MRVRSALVMAGPQRAAASLRVPPCRQGSRSCGCQSRARAVRTASLLYMRVPKGTPGRPRQLPRNADFRSIRFNPPALLRAAAMRGPAWKNTHVFCALSRCLSSSFRPNASTRVAVKAKSMSAGGRHSKVPLNLHHNTRHQNLVMTTLTRAMTLLGRTHSRPVAHIFIGAKLD